ncbi:MAG TPA: hypothetical protein VF831_03360 [Anaerolineales bacterium]
MKDRLGLAFFNIAAVVFILAATHVLHAVRDECIIACYLKYALQVRSRLMPEVW